MPRWKKQEPMPNYNATREQTTAHHWCCNNNIRISPGGLVKDKDSWTIDISLDGKTWHKSPKTYGREEVWDKYYEICLYYYNKNKGGAL